MKKTKKFITILLLSLLVNNSLNNEVVYAKVSEMTDISEDDIIKLIKDTKVYLGPSEEYEVVGNLNKNDEIVLFEEAVNDFLYIDSNKVSGFIKKDAILEKDLDKRLFLYEDHLNNSDLIEANVNVFVRKENKVNSEKLGLLCGGDKIKLLDDEKYGNWYQVEYNNQIGYVYKKYAEETFKWGLPNNYYKVGYLNEDIKLPCGPADDDLMTIAEKYDVYLIYSEDDIRYSTTNLYGNARLVDLKDAFTIIDDVNSNNYPKKVVKQLKQLKQLKK